MRHVRKVISLLLLLTVIIVIGAFVMVNIRQPYYDEMVIEAGSELFSPSYFFKKLNDGAEYVTPKDNIILNHVGTNNITISLNGLKYEVNLVVVDTTPPKATAKNDVNVWAGSSPKPEEFIEKCIDATDVTYSYAALPDFNTPGQKNVIIKATDEGGNDTNVDVTVNVCADEEPPVIYGARDRLVVLDSAVSYRDEVYVEDNYDTVVKLNIDSSAMNIHEEGSYPIVYSATDSAGNMTEVTVTFTVTQSELEKVSQSEIDEEFLKVYDSIVTDDMTKREKAHAIYKYVSTEISYVPTSDKSDWEQNAYKGLIDKKGDCYTYYSISRKLLNMAGIETMCVKRNNEAAPHYWNLINCGDGWYHFDTCPRAQYQSVEIFMYTDEQMKVYSEKLVPGYYDFDASLYPATPLS